MPSVRTPASETSVVAPYRLYAGRAREEDLRVDDPPLFRPAEPPRAPPVASHDSAEDTSPGLRRDFNSSVYECVRSIPEGKVASYGQVARLIGHPRHSRMVGAALKVLPARLSNPYLPQTASSSTGNADDPDAPLPLPTPNPEFVPWHRVVASSGLISPRANPAATRRQAEWLEAEGVTVLPANGEGAGLDGGRVRLSQFGWDGN
ncbi:hypothetical protein JCM10908_000175 [Rhodotorula pacifica]|uniref:MGMT family protein n=1 Tax=Rhodotorula pacifica TaxID=1495444 RepID=UPI00317AA03F